MSSPPIRLEVSDITIANIPDHDGATISDPYVQVSIPGQTERTTFHWNRRNVEYEDVLLLSTPENQAYPITVEFRVMDFDLFSRDDTCGQARFTISSPGQIQLNTDLTPQGHLSFTIAVSGGPEVPPVTDIETPLPPIPTPTPNVVTRQNFMSMPERAQRRVIQAFARLIYGDMKTEFATIAGYHGHPQNYCDHGQETFPGWHRAYLLRLEKALQMADQRNRRDDGETVDNTDLIALPYWDWEEAVRSQGPVIPTLVRETFGGSLPHDLIDTTSGSRRVQESVQNFLRIGFSQVRSDEDIRQSMLDARVVEDMYRSLEQPLHWQHASTQNTRDVSVERPHNQVHVAMGFPMASISFAAYYPMFWMHHCQVDRVYERYIQLEGAEECQSEMQARQRELSRRGHPNLWTRPLQPFQHPVSGNDFMPADTFNTRDLGFQYDTLPEPRPPRMSQMPQLAMFTGLQPTKFADSSYTLYVYVFASTEEQQAFVPPVEHRERHAHRNYAGETNIFGGRIAQCPNCDEREPFNLPVNITAALNRLKLSRHDCAILVQVYRASTGTYHTIDEIEALPEPMIVGPVFEDLEELLSRTETPTRHSKGDIIALQKRLRLFGFIGPDEPLDGWIGPVTERAIAAYQEAYQLTQDSRAGPQTKRMLVQPLNDGMSHLGSEPVKGDFDTSVAVRYWVGQQPGYLGRSDFLEEVSMAFRPWESACGLKFVRVDDAEDARLKITFDEFGHSDDEEKVFESSDGSGGMLAQATPAGIILDPAERWLLQNHKTKPARAKPSFEVLAVLTHEVGHVLGLPHTFNSEDIMFPYYRPGKTSLSQTERDLVASMYPSP